MSSKPFDPMFLKRTQDIYGADSDAVIEALANKPRKAIRIDTNKMSVDTVCTILATDGIETEKILSIPEALLLPKLFEAKQITSHPLYLDGTIYLQSASSMLATIVLDPQPNELILDVAAAPGSKTTHISKRMHGEGMIVANDISRQRIFKLRQVLSQNHVDNITLINFPGEIVWKNYENTFDRVLADVPCSMEGRMAIDADQEPWSMKRITQLAKRQKNLLYSAYLCAKPGGLIVYSTCTLAPEENESVVNWLLQKVSTAKTEPISLPEVPHREPLTSWNGESFSDQIQHCFRVTPTTEFEGFFIAKIRKSVI